MKLTRHARNRLRWIQRRRSDVSAKGLIDTLREAESIGYDDRGNRRVQTTVQGTELIVVIDDTRATP